MTKYAIVTGASAGLGKAIATKLVAADYMVVGLARDEHKLQGVREELGKRFSYEICDVADKASLASVGQSLRERLPSIDVLVLNAGIWYEGDIEHHSLDVLEQLLMTNVFGVMGLISILFPVMKQQQAGAILTINSVAGVASDPQWSPYAATKHALTGYMKGLYRAAGAHNIKAMQICPGAMNTDIFETYKAGYGTDHDRMMDKDDIAQLVMMMLSQPDDVLIETMTVRKLGGE